MQYEQVTPEERIELPRPSIDTGMGLERIAAVLQGVHDNYETDLFRRLIEASAEASGAEPHGPHAVSHRVVADHLRASCFLIADGVMPSNEGRGYVLRRIMRRAMRHAHLMGCAEPLMWRLVPALVGEMGQAFPELGRAQALMTETLKLEEGRFRQTLARGLSLLEAETARWPRAKRCPARWRSSSTTPSGFPTTSPRTRCALRAHRREGRVRFRHGRRSAPGPGPPGRAPAMRRPIGSGSRSAREPGPPSFWATRLNTPRPES